ncbi:MAG: hypothetical protein M1823_007404, partial [Watsoniomyces obsoletus]
CRLRNVPIVTFINKVDREGLSPFALLDEVAETLQLDVSPQNWPTGMGGLFHGLYDLRRNRLLTVDRSEGTAPGEWIDCAGIDDPKIAEIIPADAAEHLAEEGGQGQKLVGQIKEEMKSIHDLCEQAQSIRIAFPQIDYLAKVHRNFEATRAMQAGLDSFDKDCQLVQRLLEQDEQDMEQQPNLLEAHMRLTRLRDFRDEALDQIRK